LRDFQGGSQAALSLLWCNGLNTTAESVISHIKFSYPGNEQAVIPAGSESIQLSSLITGFLTEKGIPCPSLFKGLTDALSPLIDLSKIDEDPLFRSRMFLWAGTGAPFLEDGDSLLV
jgi:hypothetical protein